MKIGITRLGENGCSLSVRRPQLYKANPCIKGRMRNRKQWRTKMEKAAQATKEISTALKTNQSHSDTKTDLCIEENLKRG